MARKRFVHPDMWQDPAFAKMSRDERLLFIGLITIADDEGRLNAAPFHLQGRIFPNDHPKINSTKVRRWRDAVIAKNTNVVLYKVDGVEYIAFRRWERYQKPSKPTPSKLPPPPRGQVAGSQQ